MKISEIARLNVNKDSDLYENMLGCDLISRLQQGEMKSKDTYKKNKSKKSKKQKGK